MVGARMSCYYKLNQTLFTRGAYTESDNAPVWKTGSGYVRLARTLRGFACRIIAGFFIKAGFLSGGN